MRHSSAMLDSQFSNLSIYFLDALKKQKKNKVFAERSEANIAREARATSAFRRN